MADVTKFSELWARLADAHARGRARLGALAADRARPPAPGDVYLWPAPNELALSWAVLDTHAGDPELVLAVPADARPLAGLADVAVCEAGVEPLYLRCGRGAWLRRESLPPERRYRTLDPSHTRRARQKYTELAKGPITGDSAAWENEADPEYHSWLSEVTAAVLDATRGRGALHLAQSDFVAPPAAADLHSLAAAGADSFDALLAPPPGGNVVAAPIPHDGPGALSAIRTADGVVLLFEGAEPPPAISAFGTSGEWHDPIWAFSPDRTAARALAPWVDGVCRLRVGTGDAPREVVVTEP